MRESYETRSLDFRGGGLGGIEFGAPGRITAVAGRPITAAAPMIATKAAAPARAVVRGYASAFNKCHAHRGRVEVFWKGCFGRALTSGAAIRLLVNHDESELLATTADRLELKQDDVGLAFRCPLPPGAIGENVAGQIAAGELGGMSVGYEVVADETKRIDGVDLRIIRDARLDEISLVKTGAVAEAFAVLADGDTSRPLDYLIKSGVLSRDAAFVAMQRALRAVPTRVAAAVCASR